MQVKPIILLFIVFTISDCLEIDNTSTSTSQTEINNNRKLPLFPRINTKFIVNSQKITKKANVDQDITTKKPLMPKIIPTAKIEVNINNRVTVTRKPLMKLRNFTVKIITNRRLQKSNDDQNFTKNNHEVNSNNAVTQDRSKNLRHKTKEIEITAIARARDNRLPKIVASTPVDYFAEEHKDRKEFIFLNSTSDEKVANNDILQMDEGDFETTTTATFDVKEKLKSKRSVNIIVEENRATAIPSRKYTDHDVKLNNDRFFNNVNT